MNGGGAGLRVAGLRIANALAHGRGELQIEIDGEPWSPQAVATGEISGLRRLKPGTHRLSFSRDGLKGAEVRLRLEEGEVITLVPHAFKLEAGTWQIRVLKLESREPIKADSGHEVIAVYVGGEDRIFLEVSDLGKSWEPLALRRLELKDLTIRQSRGYLPMRVGKRLLPSLPVFEQGRQVMVLYELANGELSCLSYRDRSWPKPEISGNP